MLHSDRSHERLGDGRLRRRIVTTKIPQLSRPNQGFWYMVSDGCTDFAMFCSLVFLILAGGGAWAVEQRRRPRA